MKFTKGYWMRRNGVSITSVGQKRDARFECKRIYIYSIPYSTENRPVGGNNSETVYNYTDGLTLNIFALKDKAETVVYDNKGNLALTAKAVNEKGKITVTLDGSFKNLKICMRNICKVKNLVGAVSEDKALGTVLNVTDNTVIFEI